MTRLDNDAATGKVAALVRDLEQSIEGDVQFDAATRAMFATDASNYRHVPTGVVAPRSVEDILSVLAACERHGVAITARGAATSTSGQACNETVLIDFARHFHAPPEIDALSRRAVVLPGVVLDVINAEAAKSGLRFGPDPSTHSRCTIGGMIGNNACGAHSIRWGKTVDNVESLDIALFDGTRLSVGPTTEIELEALCRREGRVGELYRNLRNVRDTYGEVIRRSMPVLPRRVSGYNLEELLPENGFNVARALVGTEGSCALVLGAELRLVEPPKFTCLAVMGFADLYGAADNVPRLLGLHAQAIEGMDDQLVAAYDSRHKGASVRELLPPGGAWLLVEFGGASPLEADAGAKAAISELQDQLTNAVILSDPAAARTMWRIREDGAGIATRRADGKEAWPGWEDAAVPPERLGRYLRDFDQLLAEEHLQSVTYGHFGDGCVHARIDFDFETTAGVAGFRRFMEAATDLVVRHGGSLSGEHGDGQSKGELLPRMYPPKMMEAFVVFKAAFDPSSHMNPGGVVGPRPIDADLRIFTAPATVAAKSQLALSVDNGDLGMATRRCLGVGRCLNAKGGVMCPSYRVTKEERHSPRGRSHLLFEMLAGDVIDDGWQSEEVRDALDLCLGCKGCKSDCPVNVDIATYKVEFLSRFYEKRRRPMSHYSMGYLPTWLRFAATAPRLVNMLARSPFARIAKALGGIAKERAIPQLATSSLQKQFHRAAPSSHKSAAFVRRGKVIVLPDTFTNFFEPDIGMDAASVLTSLGYDVEVPKGSLCCGLTWLSTGQIDKAKKVLSATLATLEPWIKEGVPIVGLEPSCTALLRKEATELLPDDPRAQLLAKNMATFAEVIAGIVPAEKGSSTSERNVAMAQVHCHQHAEMGFAADKSVLGELDVDLTVLDEGCCGLAGNFGFERDHYEVSRLCAESGMLPAINQSLSEVTVLADGFSCRTQIRQLSDREPVHLATYVARLLFNRADQQRSAPGLSNRVQ